MAQQIRRLFQEVSEDPSRLNETWMENLIRFIDLLSIQEINDSFSRGGLLVPQEEEVRSYPQLSIHRKRFTCPICKVEMYESSRKKHLTTKKHKALESYQESSLLPLTLEKECLICLQNQTKFIKCFCCKKETCVDCMNQIIKTRQTNTSCPYCRTAVPISTFFNSTLLKVKEMIENGFHPDIHNLAGATLLYVETNQEHLNPPMIQYLLDIGAKCEKVGRRRN